MSAEVQINNERSSSIPLLEVKGLRIEGFSEKGCQEIVCGADLQLKRFEVLGLICESWAGKYT